MPDCRSLETNEKAGERISAGIWKGVAKVRPFPFARPLFRASPQAPLRMSEFVSSTMLQFLDLILNLDSKSRNSQTIYR